MWIFLVVGFCLGKISLAPYFYNSQRPLIIAHRGACGYLPEHTLQAYDVAAYMGADFIEPDLVPTRDHQLLINHEGLLNDTTNVALLPQFADLLTTKTIQGYDGNTTETGWFSEDFYLYQLKELRAKQRLPFRPETFNYLFKKITINEALDWAIQINQQRILNNQTLLGAYIELKNPAYYNSLGFPVENMLLQVLKDRKIDTIKGASSICPVILQCFELASLEYMSKNTDLPLVYLVQQNHLIYNISDYQDIVNGVGPTFQMVFNPDGSATQFVSQAHNGNLAIHPWVIRDDVPIAGWSRQETYQFILNAKLDGIFDEFPDSANIYFTLSHSIKLE
jgi:glycerophosphoryl diester phosphodiesterase